MTLMPENASRVALETPFLRIEIAEEESQAAHSSKNATVLIAV